MEQRILGWLQSSVILMAGIILISSLANSMPNALTSSFATQFMIIAAILIAIGGLSIIIRFLKSR